MLVEVTANLRRWVPQALRRGVRLGLGGDNMHGRQAWDAVELVRLGASPEGAVAALTGRGAEIAQRTDRGMFKPGKLADCVAIEGDPLRDPDALLRPRFVLCRGVITSLLPAISMAMEEAA
jgi:imidazolonepropionase-like amidohydrolase